MNFQPILLFLLKTFSLMFLGFILFRYVIDRKYLKVLSIIFVDFLIPAMIFNKFLKRLDINLLKSYWYIPVFTIGILILSYFFSIILRNLIKIQYKYEFSTMLTFTNAGYLVLPILIEFFKGDKQELSIVFNFLYTMLVSLSLWSLGAYLITGKKKKISIKKLPPMPFNFTLISIILALLNTKKIISPQIFHILNILGLIGVYGIMIVLGGILSQVKFKDKTINKKHIVLFVAIKNFLYPIIFLVIIYFLPINHMLKMVIYLTTITPPATNLAIISQRYPLNKKAHNYIFTSIFFSYITAIISIPIFVILFNILT